MRLLVTGGCGFLGSNLVAQALKRGDDVTVFDNLSRAGSTVNLEWLRKSGDFRFISGDIRSADDVRAAVAVAKPEGVFHLAGQVAMTTSIARPAMDFDTNAAGTVNLLEAVRTLAPGAAVVYSSTNKVYGNLDNFDYTETSLRYECRDKPLGFGEEVPLDFHSPYGCSKGAADQYVLDYSRIYGLDTAVFRHSSMYGGRQFPTFDQGWIGWFCLKGIEAKKNPSAAPFTISGDGKQVRDVLHADDMVPLYFAAMDRIKEVRGQAFNIGGGMRNSLSLLELFQLLEGILGVPLKFIKAPARESDQKVFVADTSKVKRFLGWEPKVDKATGLKSMLEWITRG